MSPFLDDHCLLFGHRAFTGLLHSILTKLCLSSIQVIDELFELALQWGLGRSCFYFEVGFSVVQRFLNSSCSISAHRMFVD